MDVDRDVKKVETLHCNVSVKKRDVAAQRLYDSRSGIFFIVRVPFQRVAVVALMLMR